MLNYILRPNIIAVAFMAAWMLGGSLYYLTRGKLFKFIFHDMMGWHLPSPVQKYKGYIRCSKCIVCGKDLMQDSQGYWF